MNGNLKDLYQVANLWLHRRIKMSDQKMFAKKHLKEALWNDEFKNNLKD